MVNIRTKLLSTLEDTVSHHQISEAAKRRYRAAGLLSGMIGGLIAGQGYKQLWKRIAHKDLDEGPEALSTDYSLREILISAAVQGAIYALVKTIIDRGGARLFERVTGEWPGN